MLLPVSSFVAEVEGRVAGVALVTCAVGCAVGSVGPLGWWLVVQLLITPHFRSRRFALYHQKIRNEGTDVASPQGRASSSGHLSGSTCPN